MVGYFDDVRRGIVTQKIIELNDLGIDSSVGTRFETISYAHLKAVLKEMYIQLCKALKL